MEIRVHLSESWRPRSDWGKDIYAKGEANGEAKGRATTASSIDDAFAH